jgi:hypothetical protein
MSLVILLTSPTIIAAKPPLFIGAISESVFETSLTTLSQGSSKYACLLSATSCQNTNTTTTTDDTLSCLRSLNASALQTTTCSFGPHFDGELITRTATEAFESGDYVKVPSIFGGTTEEGAKDMGTQYINSTKEANAFFRNRYPGIDNKTLDMLDGMYLDPGANGSWPVFGNGESSWSCSYLITFVLSILHEVLSFFYSMGLFGIPEFYVSENVPILTTPRRQILAPYVQRRDRTRARVSGPVFPEHLR